MYRDHPTHRQMKDPWELQKVLAQYTNEIPSENDFYLLLTEYTAGMQSTDVASWVRITPIVMLISLIIISFQAIYNLYVMVALGGFTLGRKTSLGMWNFETINCNTLTSLTFSTLSIIDWAWKQYTFSNTQTECLFLRNLISYSKFIPVILGTWLRVGDCMSLRLYLLVSEESQFYKRKGVASCFPKMAFSRFIPFTGGVDHDLHTFGDFSLPHRANIITRILASMRKANFFEIESIKALNVIIIAYLSSNIFLLSVFMPLLCVSWRDLKLKAEFLHQRLNQDGDESSNELAELMETTQDARTTLLYRSLSVFFGLASCMPGTLWELYYSRKAFSGEYPHYQAACDLLSQGVISVFLNVHLLVVNLHCTKLKARLDQPNLPPIIPMHPTPESLKIYEKPGPIRRSLQSF
ncbi:hypothetical protein PCASD_12862 [Puccinia coronata f. sp. avenae]|uniref:Uncharacterized protein n=2 Tax=Puccinia coronata f. sp. avenae TaxID=200324 RepID=A0A2N5T8V9_9BASI|nr:hypothetical protein PCASD_12862 [Puccinia coronata f. sp. avenae]